jgi:hypothetical protein
LSRDSEEGSVVLSLADRVGRRGFMAKLTMGAMGLATALAGLPQNVEAEAGLVAAGCCTLCHSSTSCTGRCCWSWSCCGASGTMMRVCKECYNTTSCAGDGCPSRCSQSIVTHTRCA